MPRLLVVLWVGAVLAAGCRADDPDARLDGVTAESLLFGGERCRADSECAAGRCSLGMCVGFLMNSVEAVRIAQHERLRQAARDPDLRLGMVEVLGQVLRDADGDPFLRARAAHALSAMPAQVAGPILGERLEDPEEPVRFQAARSLHRLGDLRGTEALRAFLEHDSPAVRALARDALAVTASE